MKEQRRLRVAPADVRPVSGAFAAAIPFRRNASGGLGLLLVASRRKRRWILPKGTVCGTLPHVSAAREAFEEAGALGTISCRQAGVYRQRKAGPAGRRREIMVEAFPLLVETLLPSWPEMEQRKRQWLSGVDAIATVKNAELRRLLEEFSLTYMTHDPPL